MNRRGGIVMGPGIFDNEEQEFLDADWLDNGLWLEQDPDSDVFDENFQAMWIIPNEEEGTSEIEGSDSIRYVKGPHKGEYVLDVLNRLCREADAAGLGKDPRNWYDPDKWEAMGLIVVSDGLKRFSPQDGHYHA